jgi:hypothetical protein
LKPGDVVVGVLIGARETKVRPAVVIASCRNLDHFRIADETLGTCS